MGIFQSNIEKLLSKITVDNLILLPEDERQSEYELQKLYDWQQDYEWVEWEEFKEKWIYCSHCKCYSEGSCICYAR
jgi:hypothetical protein